ncbi:hypothetical protein [Tautonia plasticadhaerens]|uniref:Uncharacterized protein n=1 Tax=Tautonia plasticadhaerens TaxID=2527974 RepID=A0A518H0I3_9BACT|nr:hypothetical protein [Tautonia plasticadhaerens]QDV34350.1 hypothetical protein ElP_22350 [Tautonia plasticadhaerens]
MTPNPPLPSRADTPADAVRGLASRAYRVLRLGRAEDRDEVLDLLDELHRSRRLLDGADGGDLARWFDHLEAEVSGLIAPVEPQDPDPLRRAVPSACCGGVA